MNSNPLVSVIITTYNREIALLNNAIESVKNQSYKEIELIIIDDNGVGSYLQIENQKTIKTDNNIIYIPNEKNYGAQVSRNIGILNSSGQYIAFLDDDDYWLPSKIEKQMDKILKDSSIGMVFCDGYVMNDNNPDKRNNYQEMPCFDIPITYEMLLERDYIGTTTQVLIRSEAFARSGLFDYELPARQDYEMWIRIAKYNKIEGIPDHLFVHRTHEGNQISKSSIRRGIGYLVIYNKNKEAYKKNKRAKCKILLKVGKCFWENKNYFKGLFFALRGLFSNPICFFQMIIKRAQTNV